MMDKIYYFSLILITLIVISCSRNERSVENTPLESLVKLESALFFGDEEYARKLIDIKSVYGQVAKKERRSVDSIWIEGIRFKQNLNQSEKYTSAFPFHEYKIIQEFIGKDRALLKLISLTNSTNLEYHFRLRNRTWVIISIKKLDR